MNELRDVLNNYLNLKAITKTSDKPTRAEQIAIKQTLPQIFNKILKKQNRKYSYTVKGSYGEGNLANIPWVAIYNDSITKSARRGYYIVLLFSQNMESCYLSLAQGVTNYVEAYGQSNALSKMQKVAKHALNYFTPHHNAITGIIDLHASGDLGRGYEKGNIEAFYYEKSNLPTQEQFEQHVSILLEHYDQLFDKNGKNIQDIIAGNEEDYQQTTAQQIALLIAKKDTISVKEPSQVTYTVTKNVRNSKVSAQAIINAEFKCEINPEHITFISKTNQMPYVEAHHLVPFHQQKEFKYSLDILPNIVALCPTCHRLLHYGKWKDKQHYLNLLLKKRLTLLELNNISVDLKTLKQYYKHEILNDD